MPLCYYQGRIIENIRINNTTDGYAVNGWEANKLENHSGIVDNYRFAKGDEDLIARYNRPLYVAVKLNHKVLATGDTTSVDFHIVNECDLQGRYTLEATLTDAQGQVQDKASWDVQVTGGNTYGELLHAGWDVTVTSPGYSQVQARLIRDQEAVATGDDQIFCVALDRSGISGGGQLADDSGVLAKFLEAMGIEHGPDYRSGTPEGDYVLAGEFEPQQWGSGKSDLLEWVYNGNCLVIVNNAERWAEFLADKELLDYRGAKVLGKSWYGGNFVVKDHALFAGLPVDCAFNWEYQCLATYNRKRLGLRLFNGETVVASVSDHKKEVYSSLSVIPAGRGCVVLCALDLFSCLQDIKSLADQPDIDGENASMGTFNTSRKNPANVVGQQLLLNLLNYASHQADTWINP